MKKEIEELRIIIDQLLIHNAESTARSIVLKTMILDLYKKEMSEDVFEEMNEFYRDMLVAESNNLIDELKDALFDESGMTIFRAKQSIRDLSLRPKNDL